MKSALTVVLFLLLTIGVCVDGNEESVSVTEGGSVTLKSAFTKIQTDDEIEWRFSGSQIATIIGDDSGISLWVEPDGSFRDRLQLNNQTGDLKISNISTTDSGEYKLQISSPRGSSEMIFTVKVVSADELKSVSALEGDSVTLQTSLTYKQIYDVILWRFGQQKSLVAEINRTAGIFNTSSDGPDGRFGNRLQLDCFTGSLTITNITTTDSGLYEVEISSTISRHTIHYTQSFTVTVRDALKSVSVKEGETVTLQINVTEIQKDDLIQWMFGDTVLAKINKTEQRFYTSDGPAERFRDRLKLNNHTGSLNITDTRTTDSRLYEVKISRSRHSINRRFTVTVTEPVLYPAAIAWIVVGGVVGVLLAVAAAAAVVIYCCNKISQPKFNWKTLSVIEGETVPLHPSGTEIIKEDNIRWLFKKSPLAEIRRKHPAPFNVLHENFKGRLDWPGNLGPLIITNLQITDSGLYELQIIRSEDNIQTLELFSVTVYAKTEKKIKEVKEGGSVTLESGVTGIQKDDEILWKFALKDAPIAAIQGGKKKTPPFGAGWRYRFRLNLDENGSLTIKNVRPLDTGFYTLHIARSGNTSLHLFRVKISSSEYVDLDELRKNQTQLSVLYEQLKVIHMQKEASKTQQCKSAGSGPKNSSIPMAVEEFYEQLVKLFKNQSQPPVLYEQLSESAGSCPESNPFLKTEGESAGSCPESSESDTENSPFLKTEADDHVPLHHLHEYGGALRITTVK